MDLKTLQTEFFKAIRSHNNADSADSIESEEYGLPKQDFYKKLSIYRNTSRMALINALKETYPVCERLVGSLFFFNMAAYYVNLHPSQSYSLNDYGESFALFIQDFPPVQSLPYLSDVAHLEWLISRILMGECEKGETGILFTSSYPVYRIWEINQPDFKRDEGNEGSDDVIDLSTGPCYLYLFQEELNLKIKSLSKQEWETLNS